MSKKEKNEIEFDYIAYHYVIPFVKRWRTKVRKRKGGDEKKYYFDKFISEYIIYSALVNVIKPTNAKNGNDFAYCTYIMSDFLLTHMASNNTLIQDLSYPVTELTEIIESKRFSVVSNKGKSPELLTNWNSNTKRLQLRSLLETLYFMRCNLFHGQKEYANEQVALLKPACDCLTRINKAIEKCYLEVYDHLLYS